MDKVVEGVEEAKKEWAEAYWRRNSNSLPRLNGLAQDGLASLSSFQFKLDLLVPQLPTDDEVQSATAYLESWKNQSHNLRLSMRNANLQAKANMRKAAQEERELLLGGGGESTIGRRNLQTKAGMTSAAERITESLRCTRQLMVQLFMQTRNLLSTMQRQDVIDRLILAVGVLLLSSTVLYVVSKCVGLLKLQRHVTAALKAGMVRQAEVGHRAVVDGINTPHVHENAVRKVDVPLEQPMHDEL
ncbi:hypothetical protein I3842_02G104100 [Carya illinoinensis]|uniref:Sec20 n=1 Tax=Carya illinoinensis TaxID=32201 RepID=A0A922FWM5_CARIL|nr:hypothetical protein I3842_02G104100 [Carya illinoinensis]